MQSKDLRIGNLVLGPKGAMYNSEITSWNIGEFIKCNEYCDFIEGFSPIELTEEWLERFGFHFDQNYGLFGFFDDMHAIYSLDEGGFQFHIFCCNDVDCWVKIKYVHELQNLYFALMGKELELKSESKP